MEENGNLVRFIFNQDREVVSEEDTSGLNRLIRATELIAANSGADSARTYYHYASDEMGSTTHIVDEAGAVQNRYEYDAWGNITAQEEAIPNRFKFTGQQFDPVTQQYYLRARFYNPVVARFTQEDTYRGDGLNLYAYCESNPVFYVDPTGNVADCVKDAYKKYREQGMTPQEALDAANRDYFYQKNLNNGLTPSQAADRAAIDLEVHQAMQKYQILVNQIDPSIGGDPTGHGIAVHEDVKNQMALWVKTKDFQNIEVDVEGWYRNGLNEGGRGSSRIDLLIRETGRNPQVNQNNCYIGDIKTGSPQNIYGRTQMAKNQGNLHGKSKTAKVPIPGTTHWEVRPNNTSPTQKHF